MEQLVCYRAGIETHPCLDLEERKERGEELQLSQLFLWPTRPKYLLSNI